MPTPKKPIAKTVSKAVPKAAPKAAPKATPKAPRKGKKIEELELTAADEKALDNAWAKVAREMGVVAGQPLPWRLTEDEKKAGGAKSTPAPKKAAKKKG